MDLFPVDWRAGDVEHEDADEYVITAFGKTPAGVLVAAHIAFFPYFYVRMPAGSGPAQCKLFIAQAVVKHKAHQKYCRAVERTSLWGFSNGQQVQLVQLAFPSLKRMKWAAKAFQREGMTTYESGVDPLLRFFHIRDIQPASWIRVGAHTVVASSVATTRARLEICTTFDHVSPSSLSQRPPLVLASWDLEVGGVRWARAGALSIA